MKSNSLILATTLWLCHLTPVWSADQQAAINTLKEARVLFDQAVSAQGGWVSTKSLLTDAELAVTKGDYQKALTLAGKAKREASLSFIQAQSAQKNWAEPEFLK